MIKHIIISIIVSLSLCASLSAQETVNWLTFEQLEDSMTVKPKKVFIDFYTDWCTYCRKMDKVVFTKSDVIKVLNEEYYVVRFNAETDSTITFGGRTFINDQIKKSRRPVHQIVQLLALREGQFSAPTIVILDEDFKLTARYFQYMDSKKLLDVLEK